MALQQGLRCTWQLSDVACLCLPPLQVPAATEAQQTGYNIKRSEFEPEFDHEAETIISELADFK